YGADLTNTAWIKQTGMSVEKVGWVYRIRRNRGDTAAAIVYQEIAAVAQQETWAAACGMRAGTGTVARLSVTRSSAAAFVNLTSEWQVFANTKTLEEGQIPGVSIGPEFTAGDSYIEVAGCWLTKTSTPGRPCWGGEAPVTCAADRHTISTEGWPIEAGEISITWELAEACPSGTACFVFDGRLPGADTTSPLQIWIGSTGNVTISIYDAAFASIGRQPAPGVPTTVSARRRDGEL